jgi:hypothetical protein
MKKKFEDLTPTELWNLRTEIVLDSFYFDDYTNSFGFNKYDMAAFFNGYSEHLYELMQEDNATDEQFKEYDNETHLLDWFNCHESFSWVRYEDEKN